MNAVDIYYKNQARARGLDSLNAIRSMDARVDRIYDGLVLSELPKRVDSVIYEVACGPGLMLSWLRRKGYLNVSGSDICEDYVRLARSAGVDAQCGDSLLALKSMQSESVDVVIAIDFMEHLPKDVFVDFLYDCMRVLKKGGVLVMRGPNGDSPLVGRNLYNDITHYWAYTSVSLKAMFSIVGFSSVSFKDEATAPVPLRWFWVVPLAWIARFCLGVVFALVTRERIIHWGPNFFIFARR